MELIKDSFFLAQRLLQQLVNFAMDAIKKYTCSSLFAVFVMLSSTSLVFADEIPENSWSGIWDTINRFYVSDDEVVIILEFHTYKGHTKKCGGGKQFRVSKNDPNYEIKAKTLLAAYIAGHKITPYWVGSDSCRANLNRFQIRP
ncbi:MAG: hypothetical protein ACC657_06185 [Thiohalomonadales bacterium]